MIKQFKKRIKWFSKKWKLWVTGLMELLILGLIGKFKDEIFDLAFDIVKNTFGRRILETMNLLIPTNPNQLALLILVITIATCTLPFFVYDFFDVLLKKKIPVGQESSRKIVSPVKVKDNELYRKCSACGYGYTVDFDPEKKSNDIVVVCEKCGNTERIDWPWWWG